MKKTIFLVAVLFFSGCLERERIEKSDHLRTDSALVIIEKMAETLADSSPQKEIENLRKELKIKSKREIPIVSTEIQIQERVDTLFVEKTISYFYSKDSVGSEGLILDSVSIQLDTCLHTSK